MKIDLHLHSTASDGQYSPTELMKKVKEAGITTCALTDHDTVNGIKEARKAAEELGLDFISGIEISAKEDIEFHILGYNIDEDNEELKASCEFFKNERQKRAKKIYAFLEKKGVKLEAGSVEKVAGSDNLGRPHFAKAMLQQGYIKDVREAFDKYLATPEFEAMDMRKYCSYQEAIDLIHNAGGIVVVAHPGMTKKLSEEQLLARLEKFIAMGVDGIECFYSKHDREQAMMFLTLVDKYDLVTTIGSDYHGEKVKPEVKLGYSEEYMFDLHHKIWR